MVLLVDAYAVALRALDPTAWTFFCAVKGRVMQSAAALLGHLELVALRPAVYTGEYDGPHEEAALSAAVAAVAQYLQSTLRVRVLAAQTAADVAAAPSSSSAAARLAADLTRLCDPRADEAEPLPRNDDISGADLVLFQLSDSNVGFLVVSALWMSTKFWATLSESSTLCGLVAGLLRQATASLEQSVGRHASALCNDAEAESQACGAEVADGALGLASTPPPPSQQPSVRWASGSPPPVVLGRDGCVSAALDVCGYDAQAGDPACGDLEQLTWLDGDIAAEAEAFVRDMEDAEMMLLRCSDYAVPV